MYEQEGEILRFNAQLIFTNDSKLFIKEYIFENKERKTTCILYELDTEMVKIDLEDAKKFSQTAYNVVFDLKKWSLRS